ncbi:uncharacterized protein F4812DRAFT_422906 [Daldinia caldariorum]|uniref:uncharacterized protein n=1 Tax=Daldinia caldariorum TaxID=326644 RepID=UPI0020075BCB|nr:uncharacterized protein F4812DRAFT_422906 [Daldinia caldariorum]KAI1469395.1 hypothetical protein F4812DRAFT_422906 [Daldinia caldariorum]
MSRAYYNQLCCAICDVAFLPSTSQLSKAMEWLADVVLLSDPEREFELLSKNLNREKTQNEPLPSPRILQEIKKTRAEFVGGTDFRIFTTFGDEDHRRIVLPYDMYERIYGQNDPWGPSPYFMPVHRACIDLAETIMCRCHNIVVRDLRTLWKVLRMRMVASLTFSHTANQVHRTWPTDRIQLPHGYYIPSQPYIFDIDPLGQGEWWEANPLAIPKLTSTVLDNLQSLPTARPATAQTITFHKALVALPNELQVLIRSYIVSENGIPSRCNGLLPQWMWREMLLGGEIVPFLYDIDVTTVKEFYAQWRRVNGDQEPNWELLVRKLSQVAWRMWDVEGSALKIPNGLRNRRRIWKLVGEMYVNDLAHTQPKYAPWIPEFWDRKGRPLYLR